MAVTWEQVVLFAPELADIPEFLQTLFIDQAMAAVVPSYFCVKGDVLTTPAYTLALLNYIAHLATLHVIAGETAGDAGAVMSESIGGISVSYKDGHNTGNAFYSRTGYGANYWNLLRSSRCGPLGLGIRVL